MSDVIKRWLCRLGFHKLNSGRIVAASNAACIEEYECLRCGATIHVRHGI